MNVEGTGLVEAWAEGAGWEAITRDSNIDDGDVARLLSRTSDLLRQVFVACWRCCLNGLEARHHNVLGSWKSPQERTAFLPQSAARH